MKLVPLLAAAAIGLTAVPSSVHGQRINSIKRVDPGSRSDPAQVAIAGVVSDRNDRPLAAAEVIVDNDHRAITNARGEFSIRGLRAGMIGLTARRVGYQPTTTAIQVEPGLTVQLAIRLVPAVVQLGTMVIEGKAVDKTLWQTGFYQRQNAGMGEYFDSDYMKRHRAGLGALLANIASVRVERGIGARSGAVPMGRLPNGGLCPLSVFVDGSHIPWATSTGIDEVVNPDDVLAVEVYPRASEMPATIAGRGGSQGLGSIGTVSLQGASTRSSGSFVECGAILVWTRPLEESKR